MKRSTARWTTSLAAAALLCLPAAGIAQTPATAQPPAATPQQPATTQSPAADTQNAAAEEHLRQAKTALDAIAPTAVTGRSKAQLAELKRHLTALERASAAASSSATGAAPSNPRSSAAKGKVNWGTEVAAIDKILTTMLGPASTTGSTSDPTSAMGTSGTAAAKSASLDEATRTHLMDVRKHVTAYAAAMSGAPSTPSSTASDPAASATGSATAGSTSGTAGATGTTGSTATQPPDPTTQQPEAGAQADQEAARRHLTEARDVLSQMTQLPAAAQLSGEARTQVSQLISNFNELITTQSEWRASYTKLEANLIALIGPDNTDAEATGGVSTGTTGTTGTTGATTGTAGTSGSAAVNLDPAIRGKLVEFRAKLNEFEKAAGGATAGGAASASGSTAGTAGSMTGSTAGTTGSIAGTQTTGAQATQPTTPQMGHDEAMRHVAAIEAILSGRSGAAGATAGTTTGSATGSTTGAMTGTSGATGGPTSLTLDKAQLDQLRTHLTELRRLLSEARK